MACSRRDAVGALALAPLAASALSPARARAAETFEGRVTTVVPEGTTTAPTGGVPASKAAQRANWDAAKAELNHGGFAEGFMPQNYTQTPADTRVTSHLAGIDAALVDAGGGASAFDGLSDTPSSKTGQGGRFVAVKADASGLEYVTGSPGSANAATTNYLPGGIGAVTRTVQDKLREISVSVIDFGATGDGTTDDSAAIEAAIAHVAVAAPDGGRAIFFPRGKYRITRQVFAYLPPGGGTHKGPIVFRGENWFGSQILLDPPTATETWMYDNGSTPAYYRSIFMDLGFGGMGPNAALASGFRQWSDPPPNSHEQALKFFRCNFGANSVINRVLLMTGSHNASSNTFRDTQIRYCRGDVLIFDNAQAVVIQLDGCDVEQIRKNFITVTGNGGGDVTVVGGSFLLGFGEQKGWLVELASSNNVDHYFNFIGVRTELRYANAGMVKKDNASGLGRTRVVFRDCHLRPGVDTSDVDQEWIRIEPAAQVLFDNTQLPTVGRYWISGTGNEALGENGSLDFHECRVPADLAEQIVIAGTYGRASARRCYPYTVAYELAADFDLNWGNMGRMGRTIAPKIAVLKGTARTWPHSEGASEHTVRLPIHARIIGIKVFKPATASGTNTFQLHVGPDDKSETWASSVSAAQNAAHEIHFAPPPSRYIDVGTDLNRRTVRLWSTGATATTLHGNIPGEIAIVEYI